MQSRKSALLRTTLLFTSIVVPFQTMRVSRLLVRNEETRFTPTTGNFTRCAPSSRPRISNYDALDWFDSARNRTRFYTRSYFTQPSSRLLDYQWTEEPTVWSQGVATLGVTHSSFSVSSPIYGSSLWWFNIDIKSVSDQNFFDRQNLIFLIFNITMYSYKNKK